MTSLREVISLVKEMPDDEHVRKLARAKDLDVLTVTWEDNGRSKNSSWGPCISDMTLEVEGHAMPVIRAPNFSDKTWDAPMNDVKLLVGNEHGEPLRSVTLTEYLENFRDYLHSPGKWPNKKRRGLLAPERDSHVLMSAQACFLPVPEMGGEVNFNVAVYQYQSRKEAPAVLAIIAGVNGTSAHVITNTADGGRSYQRIYFNKDGKACPFTGQLLKQYRISKGQTTNLDAPMTEEERLHNALLFIQVPLRQRAQERSGSFTFGGPTPMYSPKGVSFGGGGGGEEANINELAAYEDDEAEESAGTVDKGGFSFGGRVEKHRGPKASTTRDAIVAIGAPVGDFDELEHAGTTMKRDPRFPVRVTVQFYKTNSNGGCSAEDLAIIASQFEEVRTKTVGKPGPATSLVTEGATGRPTETMTGTAPAWWLEFYTGYTGRAQLDAIGDTPHAAALVLFKNGRFNSGDKDADIKQLTRYMDSKSLPAGGQSWGLF